MPRYFVTLPLTAAILGTPVNAQPSLSFEVAVIKPADPDAQGRVIRIPPGTGKVSVTNMTVLELIRFAYGEGLGASLEITGGPSWIDKDRYSIEAKAEAGATTSDLRLMLQSLLAERFDLKVHKEPKEVNVYALVPTRPDSKLGPKAQPWDGKCNGGQPPAIQPNRKMPRCGAFFQASGMSLEGATMAVLADMLSTPVANLGRPVVDRTGLTGEFTLQLEYPFRLPGPAEAPAADDPLAPSLFTALQEQLGLKLQSARGNIEVLVVDRAGRPSEN
jgi:uncharacterized protein (TIGR03435 family)